MGALFLFKVNLILSTGVTMRFESCQLSKEKANHQQQQSELSLLFPAMAICFNLILKIISQCAVCVSEITSEITGKHLGISK